MLKNEDHIKIFWELFRQTGNKINDNQIIHTELSEQQTVFHKRFQLSRFVADLLLAIDYVALESMSYEA